MSATENDWQDETTTVELFDTRRLEVYIDALDVAFHLAYEELLNGTLCCGTLRLKMSTWSTIHQSSSRTFILLSSLSVSTRLNSCTSCCRKESNDFQPKDLVSSVVPIPVSINHIASSLMYAVLTNRLI